MGTYVATWNISNAFREAHFEALEGDGKLPAEVALLAEAHLKYVRGLKKEGKVVAGGPVVSFTWALLLLRADSLGAAKALAENDPAAKGGLFSKLNIEPWYHMV